MAFVRTVKTKSSTGQINEYVRVVESYYQKGKRKQRVIANLGNVVVLRKDIKRIVNGLLQKVGEKPLIFAQDLRNEEIKEYGVGYLASFMWQELGLKDLVEKILKGKKVELDYSNWIKMMVVNKLSDPTSKLGIFEWLSRVWWSNHGFDEKVLETVQKEEEERIDIAKKEVMKFYRGMDYLLGMKEEIENHLYYRFRDLFSLEVDLVFYDLTSSYFEGDGPEGLAKLGYSRDHEPGKPQVVIGLILCNGLPIGHEVFEGNRVDKKTVKEVLAKLKEQFKINRCIFVGDRGLVSKENLEILEKEKGFESILALRKRRNKEVKEIMLEGTSLIYCRLEDNLEYRERRREDGLRYIICRHPEIAKEQREERQENMAEIEKELEELKGEVDKQKRPSLKKIVKKVEDILSFRHGYGLYKYKLDEKNKSFEYFRNEEGIRLENELDGVYILRTYEKDLSAEEIIESYKDLQDVERAFRSLKTPLELRPFYHHKEERVKAHVFICVLAYIVQKVVEKMLREGGINVSGERVFSLFKQMGIAVMKVGGKSYGYTSEPTYMQNRILKTLKIKSPSRIIMEEKNRKSHM
ncbi:MAG: IS1634 family transposase [bacterium]